ncbi:hypothetical protein ACFYYB_35345 [Streptomyces sp. NPDC002886]|uniref:hypothetical protein n=1 Tax=Streptomyces sp. NPDC002886 TaxID=3364667 RepID=UPI0036AD8EC2
MLVPVKARWATFLAGFLLLAGSAAAYAAPPGPKDEKPRPSVEQYGAVDLEGG